MDANQKSASTSDKPFNFDRYFYDLFDKYDKLAHTLPPDLMNLVEQHATFAKNFHGQYLRDDKDN